MTTNQELCPRLKTTDVVRPVVPILIQVPSLRPRIARTSPARTRRRRLRKEVRVAGLTMMSVLPVGFLLLALGGAQPLERPRPTPPASAGPSLGRPEAEIPPILAVATPNAVPVEPTISPASVVLRGYLLPDDGPEEPEYDGR